MSAREGVKPTRTEDVSARLRADILGGILAPGARLKFPDLAARYEASIGVIREALVLLVARGLITSEAHQGFQVANLTDKGHAELCDARSVVEVLVLRRAIAEGDLAWEAELVAAYHRFERTPRATHAVAGHPGEAWLLAHARFHQALLDGCGNRRLLAMAAALREEAELYRRWCRPAPELADAVVDPVLADEHRTLKDAALARDADAAAAALDQLITRTGQLRITLDPAHPW